MAAKYFAKYNGGLGNCPVEVEGHTHDWSDGKEHEVSANVALQLEGELKNGKKLFTIRIEGKEE